MPKIVDREEQRLQLARAAMRVIARSGIQGATVRAVAREAGVSSGLLAHYFDDHGELIAAAMEAMVDECIDFLRRQSELMGDEAHRVESLVESLCGDPCSEDVSVVATLRLWAESAIDPELRRRVGRSYSELHRAANQLVEEAMKSGEVDDSLDPTDVTDLLVALGDGLCVARTLRPRQLGKGRVARISKLAGELLRAK